MSANPSVQDQQKLVWMDLEMTGLDPSVNGILEIAVLVTDLQLNIIAEGPHLILQQEAATFATMDAWNQDHHSRSGLWAKALLSTINPAEAERQVLDFLRLHMKPKQGILSGNSIWQDRRFIDRYMPALDAFLHYRMVDVSTLKTLAQSWYKGLVFRKKEAHRALDDIKESLAELQFYRERCFLPPTAAANTPEPEPKSAVKI